MKLLEASEILKGPYPPPEQIRKFPFSDILQKVWEQDEGYAEHGPRVLEALNYLLGPAPAQALRGATTEAQIATLQNAINQIIHEIFPARFRDSGLWNFEKVKAFFRIAALYHDIGKYIIKDRHPTVGWHTVLYINPDERRQLEELLENNYDYFQLLLIIIRDHDQFGVLGTGEASYPILLRAANSMGEDLDTRIRIISALMLFNLADMCGVFNVDGANAVKLVEDWRWMFEKIKYCSDNRLRLDEYIVEEASRPVHTYTRVQRLLVESSRKWPRRRAEMNDDRFVRNEFMAVFGTDAKIEEFSYQFTRVCKLDYGKRFFDALMEFCEGPEPEADRKLPFSAPSRVSKEDVLYSVLAILKRITSTYAAMTGREARASNLIGVELKDLTPTSAPEKTARIIELIVKSHFPGLTWMMSDVPAWYF